ncbi:L,D-transpeptidase family protein [Selenihalanaerobacter shriftii]|uniref:Putative peptidoglycan binding domain-containing protein n=1 Tax=Selenihalanaerobacter shriftii TaxID=142842 RepID=A0A1T4LEE5_9FIRM|nr:peptidoglycan-binding protein [Selenihalanaerobacter shriftii]SJZ52927.1 Putative peptidoglycan binding domain-containing protein [Selenihalanaerobacter shriftii]
MRKLLLVLIILLLLSVNISSTEISHNCSCYQSRKISLQYPPLKGDDIWELQRELKILNYYKGKINSLYDWNTYIAVKRFQYANGLKGDGMVTDKLWSDLGKAIYGENIITANKNDSPPEGVSILVDTYKMKLIVYSDGSKYAEFPIAIGKPSSKSPIGEFKIIQKVDMWNKSVFGYKWMKLSTPWGNYGVHGTNKPGSIGYASSNGCIRMFNKDVEKLYSWVKIGTKVKIIGYRKPVKITHAFRSGNKGKDVLLFQEKLREHGFDPGCTDGIFSTDTKKALKEFKYIYGLKDDVIADENIFYILNIR